jgi:thiol-disulfide isomerase/thioredoxin
MVQIVLVTIIIIGLLFIYYVFFSSTTTKEKMTNKLKVVNYNTSWCGYSIRFQPIWNDFVAKMKATNSNVELVDMKCDLEENESKCRVPEVEGYPTVVLYENDKSHVFDGNRTVDGLIDFVKSYSK